MTEGTCSVDGCEKPPKTRGWCNGHYLKWYRNGDPEYRPSPRPIVECAIDGCSRPAKAKGWCNTHYLRWWQTTDPGKAAIRKYRFEKTPCSFSGCSKPSRTDGLCDSHRRQLKQGKELAPLQRRTNPAARDESGRKLCISCDGWLPIDSFTRSANRADGLSARCSQCERSAALKRKFGITLPEYEALLREQGGGCAVCGKTEEANGRRLAVDHDHSCCASQRTCGHCVRGLLCSTCNLHFGAIGDSLAHIEAMATYLRSTSRFKVASAPKGSA